MLEKEEEEKIFCFHHSHGIALEEIPTGFGAVSCHRWPFFSHVTGYMQHHGGLQDGTKEWVWGALRNRDGAPEMLGGCVSSCSKSAWGEKTRNVKCPSSEGSLAQQAPDTHSNDESAQLESYEICFKNSCFLFPPALVALCALWKMTHLSPRLLYIQTAKLLLLTNILSKDSPWPCQLFWANAFSALPCRYIYVFHQRAEAKGFKIILLKMEEANFSSTQKLGQEAKVRVCSEWPVLGQPEHGAAASLCRTKAVLMQYSWWHRRGWVFRLCWGILLFVSRCLGNVYILDNDSWKRKDCRVSTSESWCKKAVITQRKNCTSLLSRTVRSGQGLCWSQIFTGFTIFLAITLSLHLLLENILDVWHGG